MEKNNISKHTGLLFELKIGLNKENSIVIDYGGKPVGKIREALKDFKYQANLCAAKRILLEWVKHLVKKENQYNITPEKFKVLLDTISYKWNGTTKVLQPMSYRWLVQTLKKNPEATLEDIEKLIEPSERALRRERMAREGPIAF